MYRSPQSPEYRVSKFGPDFVKRSEIVMLNCWLCSILQENAGLLIFLTKNKLKKHPAVMTH